METIRGCRSARQAHDQTGGAGPSPGTARLRAAVRRRDYRLVTVTAVCTTGVDRMIGDDSLAVSVWVPGCRAVAR